MFNRGFRYLFKISPTVVSATSALRNLPIRIRQCRFPDEGVDLKAFNKYSKEACEAECLYKRAIEMCGYCIPWNMPQASTKLDSKSNYNLKEWAT